MVELQLAHFSVQQYLMSKRIEADFPRKASGVGVIFQKNLSEISARGSITRICLAYLSLLDERRPIGETRAEFPLAQYSAQYWMDHAMPAEVEKEVEGSILNFFLRQREAYKVWGKLFDPDTPFHGGFPTYKNMATPLYYASLAGLNRTAKLLLDNEADVNAQGGFYCSALQASSARGHREIVQLLLNYGADVNAQGGEHGNALQAASAEGHEEIVQLLLDNGADINAQGGECTTALLAALAEGHDEIARLLLNNGADDTQDLWCGNALQTASINGYKEIMQLLLDYGADVNAPGGFNGRAL